MPDVFMLLPLSQNGAESSSVSHTVYLCFGFATVYSECFLFAVPCSYLLATFSYLKTFLLHLHPSLPKRPRWLLAGKSSFWEGRGCLFGLLGVVGFFFLRGEGAQTRAGYFLKLRVKAEWTGWSRAKFLQSFFLQASCVFPSFSRGMHLIKSLSSIKGPWCSKLNNASTIHHILIKPAVPEVGWQSVYIREMYPGRKYYNRCFS